MRGHISQTGRQGRQGRASGILGGATLAPRDGSIVYQAYQANRIAARPGHAKLRRYRIHRRTGESRPGGMRPYEIWA